MASATACALITPAVTDRRAASRQPAAAAPHFVALPPPNIVLLNHPQGRDSWKSASYCHKTARNVVAMATGETPADVATELPEIAKTIQDAWDRLEDKYAVTSLAFAGAIALWGSNGLISAIDTLPLVPVILEIIGIGYTGWFAYRNLVFKPDREALIEKIKNTYSETIGSS